MNLKEFLEFDETDKARRKEWQFLRKNGLIRNLTDSKLTEEQKRIIKGVIPNITPQQDFNFYEIFYTPGDLKIEDKKNNSYDIEYYFYKNAYLGFPTANEFDKNYRKEYEKWFDVGCLKNYQRLWIKFLFRQQIKYGEKFIDDSVFNYCSSEKFKEQAASFTKIFRLIRNHFYSSNYVDNFVDELEEDFDKNLEKQTKLPSQIFLEDKYIEEKFREYRIRLEDYIRKLEYFPALPDIENINENDKIKEFKENAQKKLVDKEKSIIKKIRQFDKIRQRKMKEEKFYKELTETDIEIFMEGEENEIFFANYTLGQWFDIYKNKRTIREKSNVLININGRDVNFPVNQNFHNKNFLELQELLKTERDFVYNKNRYEGTIKYPWKSKINYFIKEHPDVEIDCRYPDNKINIKKFLRPSFSEFPGCWEIDEVFNLIQPDDQFLFCINVNTRFLVVYFLGAFKDKDPKILIDKIRDLKRKYLVKSIRCDGDSRHNTLQKTFPDISFFINSSKFVFHSKLVDACVKTIRDAIGYRYLNETQLQTIVSFYNDTYHESIKMTPKTMQFNRKLELIYIRKMKLKLDKAIIAQRNANLRNYLYGNVLMLHIVLDKTEDRFEKNRRRFNNLGIFLEYDHGNVVCQLFNGVIVSVPIFYTRFVAIDRKHLPKSLISTFNIRTGEVRE